MWFADIGITDSLWHKRPNFSEKQTKNMVQLLYSCTKKIYSMFYTVVFFGFDPTKMKKNNSIEWVSGTETVLYSINDNQTTSK